jgi:hypothetical protein
MHCSKSENSNDGRIGSLTKHSILPLEMCPKRWCHNFEDTSSILLPLFLNEETFTSFSELITLMESLIESK